MIGIISDTHGLLRPEALDALKGSRLIVHAGDIGSLDVVEGLADLAPVIAIRGNVDRGEWAGKFPPTATREMEGRRFHVLHDLKEIDFDPAAARIDLVISGHSHKPDVHYQDGVLYVNPGSAGPRRFRLPISIATLWLTPSGMEARVHALSV